MGRRTRSAHRPSGEPVKCGLCGHAVIAGLVIGGKPANQAMTTIMGLDLASTKQKHIVTGRIHVDKRVCKALEKVTDEELARPRRAEVSPPQVGGDDHDAVRDALHSLERVGLDQAGDGG